MQLIDVLPPEIWGKIENETNEKFGLNGSVRDADGRRLTIGTTSANSLCAAIAADTDGRAHICAAAHRIAAKLARREGEPVVTGCSAGMVTIVVPIFIDGEFVGTFDACGRPSEGKKPDLRHVKEVTGIPVKEGRELARGIAALSEAQSREVADFLAHRVRAIVESVLD